MKYDYTVAYICHYPYLTQAGGIGSFVKSLTFALLETGHIKVAGVYPSTTSIDNSEELRGNGLLILRPYAGMPPRFLGSLYPTSFWRAFNKIREVSEKDRVDILHLHSLYVPSLAAAAVFYAKFAHIPLVVTSHSCGHQIGLNLRERVRQLIAARIVSCSGVFLLGVSQASIVKFRKKPGFIQSGLDLNYFTASRGNAPAFRDWLTGICKKRIKPETSIAFYPARILPEKRQHDLIGLAQRLKAARLDAVVVVVGSCCGQKNSQYANFVRGEIEGRSLSDYFVFIDQAQPRELVRDGLAAASVLVFPSLNEAMPVAVIEASAMSVPVVGYDISGLAAVVQSGLTGVLVPPKDSDALSNAVMDLLTNPDTRIRMGRAARQVLSERECSIENLAARHDRLYRQICSIATPLEVEATDESTTSGDFLEADETKKQNIEHDPSCPPSCHEYVRSRGTANSSR
jgi:glycosyltransferase involved in cell wall biosynthesis